VGRSVDTRLRHDVTGRNHGGRRLGSRSNRPGVARRSARARLDADALGPQDGRCHPWLRELRGHRNAAPAEWPGAPSQCLAETE
jgi:hypothetical protein